VSIRGWVVDRKMPIQDAESAGQHQPTIYSIGLATKLAMPSLSPPPSSQMNAFVQSAARRSTKHLSPPIQRRCSNIDSKNQPIVPFASSPPNHGTSNPPSPSPPWAFLSSCAILPRCFSLPSSRPILSGKRPKSRPQSLGHAAPSTRS
jgi:hypothetical protein